MSEGHIGEGGGRSFERVAGELRERMASGRYPLNSLLPPQRELADEFRVSRDTVQRVLRELKSEGWIEFRQGSGSKVIKSQRIHSPTSSQRPDRVITLGPLISAAFERPEVTLDVYTLTSESLDVHIRLQAERIRAGVIAPERIALRILLPSASMELPYPRTVSGGDAPRLRDRFRTITQRSTESLSHVLRDLEAAKLVPTVEFHIRHAPLTPTFKLYVINGVEVLHGLYQVVERELVLDSGEQVRALDVMGLGATLTRHVEDDDPDSAGSVFVDTMRKWYESVWDLLSERSC
ncbi:winged helix-turn-helix domain-containing protein [Streptomyces iakyrus]|uniref:winged helix-turn-helix domain-containing protein n=1 Tax=Streptomyces iakyrus TaxID=68219 RepID=UPI0036B0348E